MRCAREGGGSAWTARAPLVPFLTRERQKGKTTEENRARAAESRGPFGSVRRQSAAREPRVGEAERRSAGLEPGEIRRACPTVSSFLFQEREREREGHYHIERSTRMACD